MALVTKIYIKTSIFPKEEVYGLTSQIKRASISVPSSIAEGYGRESKKEYLRFLNISVSSLFELQTQLEISLNLNFLSQKEFEEIYQDSREVERMLSSFIRKIKTAKTDSYETSQL